MAARVASYNIHRCYGRDGQYSPQRIREVLHLLDADILALQEVELLHDAPDLLKTLCADRPWQAIEGITMTKPAGHYGNALLTTLPVLSVERLDLSFPNREPRGALQVVLDYQGEQLAVYATHLGLRPVERRWQILQLLGRIQQRTDLSPTLLLGDLNEWFLWGRPLRWLKGYFLSAPSPATFPSRWPVFALDRIWASPAHRLEHIKAVNTPLTRQASDHLPLVAELS